MSTTTDRRAWEKREALVWLAHPHFCHACGRAVDPDAEVGDRHRGVVHHLTYRYGYGNEPDCVLVPLCAPCHDAPGRWARPALHTTQRRVSRAKGWMKGARITNDERHYRHLWSYSIRWLRWKRFWATLTPGRTLPAWSAPHRRWR